MPIVPGLVVASVLAGLATLAARGLPLVGAPVLAIVLGIVLRAAIRLPVTLSPGLAFAAKYVLQAGIVVSGFGLSLAVVVQTGWDTLPVTIGTVAVALVLAPIAGRFLRLDVVLATSDRRGDGDLRRVGHRRGCIGHRTGRSRRCGRHRDDFLLQHRRAVLTFSGDSAA